MVELWRIELQSETTLLLMSTCLEKLFEFNLASHNLQSYIRRSFGVHFMHKADIKYIYIRVILRVLSI